MKLGIVYLAVFQFNEFQGQLVVNPLNSNYYFGLGSDATNSDANDPKWDLVFISGISQE